MAPRPGSELEKARPMTSPLGLRTCRATDSAIRRDRLRHRAAGGRRPVGDPVSD